VAEYADKMLGGTLITKQSGPAGKPVNTLLIAKKMNLVSEKYFAIMCVSSTDITSQLFHLFELRCAMTRCRLDRATAGPLIIACSEGGTSIEDLAAEKPEKIIKVRSCPLITPLRFDVPIDLQAGISDAQAAQVVEGLNVTGDKTAAANQLDPLLLPAAALLKPLISHSQISPRSCAPLTSQLSWIDLTFTCSGLTRLLPGSAQIKALYKLFSDRDCTMVEVNPLAEDADGNLIAADAKIGFDDNAFFRQEDIFEKRDVSQEDPREVSAAKWDLNYIGLDGNIGCMVNGAGMAVPCSRDALSHRSSVQRSRCSGLAMATMDIIAAYGGSPANFLDVGGSAKVVVRALPFVFCSDRDLSMH
ncbi:MAG: hypothetical protein SGPRY_009090, partial [Prymnesium sp.]